MEKRQPRKRPEPYHDSTHAGVKVTFSAELLGADGHRVDLPR